VKKRRVEYEYKYMSLRDYGTSGTCGYGRQEEEGEEEGVMGERQPAPIIERRKRSSGSSSSSDSSRSNSSGRGQRDTNGVVVVVGGDS